MGTHLANGLAWCNWCKTYTHKVLSQKKALKRRAEFTYYAEELPPNWKVHRVKARDIANFFATRCEKCKRSLVYPSALEVENALEEGRPFIAWDNELCEFVYRDQHIKYVD